MKIFFQTAASILFATLFLLSCEGKIGPEGPKLSGNITGFVILVNANGGYVADRSGAIITIEGTPIADTTDENGNYLLKDVETGIYNIEFSKSGFGVSKIQSYQFIGDGDSFLGNTYLCAAPNYYISNITATPGTSSVSFSITFSQSENGYRRIILFLGNANNVSYHPENYQGSMNFSVNFSNGIANVGYTASSFYSYGFESGSNVYGAAYCANPTSCGYTDRETGRYVYTNLNTTSSNKINFILP